MEKNCDCLVSCCCWCAAWFQFITWGEGRPEPRPNHLQSCTLPPSVGEDTLPSVTQLFSLTTELCGDVKVLFWASSSFRLFDTGIRSEGCSWAPQRSWWTVLLRGRKTLSFLIRSVKVKDGVWCLWAAELRDAQISRSEWHTNRGI